MDYKDRPKTAGAETRAATGTAIRPQVNACMPQGCTQLRRTALRAQGSAYPAAAQYGTFRNYRELAVDSAVTSMVSLEIAEQLSATLLAPAERADAREWLSPPRGKFTDREQEFI
jgi:hypothetical protein